MSSTSFVMKDNDQDIVSLLQMKFCKFFVYNETSLVELIFFLHISHKGFDYLYLQQTAL